MRAAGIDGAGSRGHAIGVSWPRAIEGGLVAGTGHALQIRAGGAAGRSAGADVAGVRVSVGRCLGIGRFGILSTVLVGGFMMMMVGVGGHGLLDLV